MSDTASKVSGLAILLSLAGQAHADPLAYQQRFSERVLEFANLNRLNTARLHRDVHADCYIPVTVATVIRGGGSVKDAFIVESSTVPVVDRYFLYVIRREAPGKSGSEIGVRPR